MSVFDLRATAGALSSLLGRFTAQDPPPTGDLSILSVSRTSGPPGVMIVVTGSGFAPTDEWRIGGVVVEGWEFASATTARIVVPWDCPGGVIRVTNAGGTVATPLPFTVITDERYYPRVKPPRMCHYNPATRMIELLPGYAARISYATYLPPTEVVITNQGSVAANRTAVLNAFTAACNGTGPRRIRINRDVSFGTLFLNAAPPEGQRVYIEGDAVKTGELRPEGQRVGADDSALMPKSYLTEYNIPSFMLGPNAARIRITGIEMAIDPVLLPSIRASSGRGAVNPFSYLGFLAFDVLDFSPAFAPGPYPRFEGNPRDIILDRCRLVSDIEVGVVRGVLGNIDDLAILDCELLNFAWAGSDAQCINATSCAGRHVIRNNRMTCALGEHVLYGGGRSYEERYVPSDIFLDGNSYDFPIEWDSLPWNGEVGLSHKAMLEVKHARRLVDQRAIHQRYPARYSQNNVYNFQTGDQGAPLGSVPYARTEDMTVRFTDVRECTQWASFNTYGSGPDLGYEGFKGTRRIDFRHNRFQVPTTPGRVDKSGLLIFMEQGRATMTPLGGDPDSRNLVDVWIEYNVGTGNAPGFPSWITFTSNAASLIRARIRNNIMLVADPGGTPTNRQMDRTGAGPLPNAYAGLTKVDCEAGGNLLAPATAPGAAAINSTAVATIAAALLNADGSLQSSSPGKGVATDGGDPGADIALLTAAIATVLTGRS